MMNSTPSGTSTSNLCTWHKKQAAMLHHFTSLDYLKTLHALVTNLLNGIIDPLLDLAKTQNRDQVLVDKVWGIRNTSGNWANNAWPFLKDLQLALSRDISLRISTNRFRITAVNECLRGMNEYSLGWATPDEEKTIEVALDAISAFADNFDRTVEEYVNRWSDFTFAYCYPAFAALHREIPRFVVRNDVRGLTGKVPPKTGIYISVDDPYAALQFAWKENGGTELREANTFNDIGLAALSTVGRAALWFDEKQMFNFAMSPPYAGRFHGSVHLRGEPDPYLAPAAVARSAFKRRSCEWALVESIPDEFEELASLAESETKPAIIARRIIGGERCAEPGFYFTPSAPNSRRFFAQGEIAPNFDSAYGVTYWQWDPDQTK